MLFHLPDLPERGLHFQMTGTKPLQVEAVTGREYIAQTAPDRRSGGGAGAATVSATMGGIVIIGAAVNALDEAPIDRG